MIKKKVKKPSRKRGIFLERKNQKYWIFILGIELMKNYRFMESVSIKYALYAVIMASAVHGILLLLEWILN